MGKELDPTNSEEMRRHNRAQVGGTPHFRDAATQALKEKTEAAKAEAEEAEAPKAKKSKKAEE